MAKLFISNTDEWVEHVAAPASTNFKSYRSKSELIQDKYIIPFLGLPFAEECLALLDSVDEKTALQLELISKIRYPIAQLMLRESADIMNITITAGGYQVNEDDKKKVASANRVELLKEQLTVDGQFGIDRLMSFLEAQASEFTTWGESDARKAFKKYFIQTPAEFNTGLLGMEVGQFIFYKMVPTMDIFESRYLKPILGAELYTEMKTKLRDSVSLGVYAPILPLCQRALAALVFAECAVPLGIKVSERGVYITSIRNANEPQQTNALGDSDKNSIEFKHREHSTKCFEDLSNHLVENVDTYTLFKESSAYTSRTHTPRVPSRPGVYYGL